MSIAYNKPSSSSIGSGNTTTSSKMTSSSPRSPSPPKPTPDEKDDQMPDLPLPSRVALAFLGHWFPKKEKPEAKPLMIHCTEDAYGTMKASRSEDEKGVQGPWLTMNDDTPLITFDGNMNMYEDRTSIRRRLTEFSCYDVVGLVFLLCSCCMMLYDLEAYVRGYWGVKEYALHFVTYTTFIAQLMVVPYWCFYTRIKYSNAKESKRRVSTMSRVFMARRINIIRKWRPEAKRILSWLPFSCILAWPVMTGCFRMVYDYFLRVCKTENIHQEISHWNTLIGLIIYGCFCYIIYLERRSFEIETRQIYRYALEQAPFQNIDGVLDRIRIFNKQYKVLRQQIRMWMAFTIVVSTWGLTSHITWNYLVFSHKNLPPEVLRTVYFLNALVTTQKITFIAVPYFALGGLNMDHIWRRFKDNIVHSRDHKCQIYWKAVIRYVKDINKTFSGDLTPSLISTGLGIYLGLNLTKSQDIGFWVGPGRIGCNLTNISGL